MRAWPWLGGALLLVLAGWLWWRTPKLINPWRVMQHLSAGDLQPGTLELMAVMLPIMVLACLGLVALLILFGFQAMRNESRLLRLLQRVQSDRE